MSDNSTQSPQLVHSVRYISKNTSASDTNKAFARPERVMWMWPSRWKGRLDVGVMSLEEVARHWIGGGGPATAGDDVSEC
jgi:hypothetical protein